MDLKGLRFYTNLPVDSFTNGSKATFVNFDSRKEKRKGEKKLEEMLAREEKRRAFYTSMPVDSLANFTDGSKTAISYSDSRKQSDENTHY